MTVLLPLTPDGCSPRPAQSRSVDLSLTVERDSSRMHRDRLQAPSGSNRQACQWVPVDDPRRSPTRRPLSRSSMPTAAQRGLREGDTRPPAAPPSQPRRCTFATPHEFRAARCVQEGRVEELPSALSQFLGSCAGNLGFMLASPRGLVRPGDDDVPTLQELPNCWRPPRLVHTDRMFPLADDDRTYFSCRAPRSVERASRELVVTSDCRSVSAHQRTR